MFVKLYSGSKKLRSACSGNIRPVQSTNLVSDWPKAENSPVDVEEIKQKLDDDVARYFTRFRREFFYLLTCGRCSLVSGTQNYIVVS